jgi:hypothetical protein
MSTLATLPSYLVLAIAAACIVHTSAALFILGKAVLGASSEPLKRLVRLLRAARGK